MTLRLICRAVGLLSGPGLGERPGDSVLQRDRREDRAARRNHEGPGLGCAENQAHRAVQAAVRQHLDALLLSLLHLHWSQDGVSVRDLPSILPLPLPYPCDPKNGNAKFDSKKCVLSVTLPIIRDD